MRRTFFGGACALLASLVAGQGYAQVSCSNEAKYDITFSSNWTASSHNGAVPSNAHFSPMVVATHNEAGTGFQLGGKASVGFKQVAETGKLDLIRKELDADFKAENVRAYRTGKRLNAVDQSKVTLTASPDRPMLTMVSMIAPSPDWVVGLPGLTLCQNGSWISNIDLNLPAIDAGTDSGTSLTAKDSPTDPQGHIFYLDKAFNPTSSPDSRFGVLTITRR